MVIIVLLIIAFWFLPLPLALQVLMTIFGSLSVLFSIGKIIYNCYKRYHGGQPRKTGYATLDRFIK